MVIFGYLLDILAVPALALVGDHGWIMACMLLVIQRMGKAIKKPAKNTIMSFAASQEGVGKSFGIQELLDQIGAFLGVWLGGRLYDLYGNYTAVWWVGVAVGAAFRELKLVAEPGGAVALAALLAGRCEARGKTVVVVLSGGNVDADLFARLIG